MHSTGGDLLLTAAHCVSGAGVGLQFVPGYAGGAAPQGVWSVTAAFVDPAYAASRDEADDVAVLRVAPRQVAGTLTAIEQLTGGYTLGGTASAGDVITVPAYPAGQDDPQMTCTTRLGSLAVALYPTFVCGDYPGGVSGAPFVKVDPASGALLVTGVLGGLHEGGCTDSISYATPFTAAVTALVVRADSGAPSDDVPPPAADGC